MCQQIFSIGRLLHNTQGGGHLMMRSHDAPVSSSQNVQDSRAKPPPRAAWKRPAGAAPAWWVVCSRELADLWIGGKAADKLSLASSSPPFRPGRRPWPLASPAWRCSLTAVTFLVRACSGLPYWEPSWSRPSPALV